MLWWYSARLIKEGVFVYTMHLKDTLVLFGCEGLALILPLSHLSPSISMLCHCSLIIIILR